MMTTETPARLTSRPRTGTALVMATAVVAVLVGGVVAAIAFMVDSGEAGWGALVGAGITAFVFTFGTLTVHVVAGLMPQAAMLVALLTYTLQVVLLLVVFLGLQQAGLIGDELDPEWLAGGVIAVTVAWTIGQVVLFARARIPAFEAGAQ